jgi:hypothetical protein
LSTIEQHSENTTPDRDHKFLSIAVYAKRLTLEQAYDLLRQQQEANRFHGIRLKIGEHAVNRKYMTHAAVEENLRDQEQQRKQHTFYRDIISEFPKDLLTPQKFDPEFVNRLRFACGIAILLVLILCWLLTGHDWEIVARAGHLCAVAWLVLELTVPMFVNRRLPRSRRIAWKRLPERITPAIFMAAFTYIASFIVELSRSAPRASGFRYWHTSLSFWITLTAMFTLYLLTYGAGVWRRNRIYFFQARSDLMRTLIGTTEAAIGECAKLGNGTTPKSIKQVLEVAACVMQLDPWGQIVAKLTFRKSTTIPASLWYYEPSAEQGKFDVKAWSAPGAPKDVKETFESVASRYKALAHDEEWFNSACESCSQNGAVDENKFLDEYGSQMKTSLVGWTYDKASALTSLNPPSRLVFNRDHETIVPEAKDDPTVARWLVVNDFACCPVFDPASLKVRPAGVLILLKNHRIGISHEDRTALATTAAMIGFLVSKGIKNE